MRKLLCLLLFIPFCAFAQTEDLPYFTNDAFIEQTLNLISRIPSFRKKFGKDFTLSVMPIKNKYDKNVVDTIFTFSQGKTFVKFYKAKHQDILSNALIITSSIVLARGIKVKDTKASVLKRLGIKSAPDVFKVGELEGGAVFTFYFLNSILSRIDYEAYLE